jgi:hypothetical protein
LKRRCGPQFCPDQRVRRGGHLEGMKRVKTAYHYGGLKIVPKDAKWLKMLICN